MRKEEPGDIKSPSLMDQEFGESYGLIDDLITGYKRYKTLLWALDSGITEVLHREGQMEPEVLVEKLEYQPDTAGLMIDALVEIGILERTGTTVNLCSFLAPYLVQDSPLYQGDSIRSSSGGIWEKNSDPFKILPDIKEPVRKMSPEFLRTVYQHSMRGELPDITRILCARPEFQSAGKLLDIGGGHGMYSISFCQQNAGLSAIILDKPSITPFTQEMVKRYQMEDRISAVPGDMNTEIPGSGYDLVFASHVMYRLENLSSFLIRIIQKMNPGALFISNHKFENDWINPDGNALATLDIVTIKNHHHMMPEAEFEKNLMAAGFSGISMLKVRATTGHSTLHIAKKPA